MTSCDELLSICIVSYNTKECLTKCIDSILSNGKGIDYEMIVVDNYSGDGTVEMLRNDYPQVRLIINSTNIGYARAVNQAIDASRGQYLLIINSDVVLLPQCLSNMIHFVRNREDAGVVGCRVLNADRSIQRSCRSFPNVLNFISENFFLDKIFPKNKLWGRPFLSYFGYDRTTTVDVVLGAFMMIRREIIDRVGKMDEQFFMYAEETDFCYRVKNAGWKNYFFPEAQIIHCGGESTRQASIPMFIELHKSHHRYIEKHHGRSYLAIIKSILFLGILLRIVLFSLARGADAFGLDGFESSKNRLQLYIKMMQWYLYKQGFQT